MKFQAGDRVQRNRPDAVYTGEVIEFREHRGKYVIRWPDKGRTICTELPESELKLAVPKVDPDEELEKMAEAAVKSAPRQKSAGGKVAAQKLATRQSATAPKNGAVPKKLGEGNLVTKLTAPEKKVLAQCVDTVKKAQALDQAANEALSIIRDQRLYRETDNNFQDFCEREFGLGRQAVDRNIVAATIYKQIESGVKAAGDQDGVPIPMPRTESQIRPLRGLPTPEERTGAYLDAVKEAGDKPVTAKLIEAAVARRQGKSVITTAPARQPANQTVTVSAAAPEGFTPTLEWKTIRVAEVDGKGYIVAIKADGTYDFFEGATGILDIINGAFFVTNKESLVETIKEAEQYITGQDTVRTEPLEHVAEEAPAES
jgi:hypothetical protein